MADRDRAIERHRAIESDQNRTIDQVRSALGTREREMAQGQSALGERDRVIAAQRQTIAQLETSLAQQKSAADAAAKQIQDLEANMREQVRTVAALNDELQQLRGSSLPLWVAGATLAGGLLGGFGLTRWLGRPGIRQAQPAPQAKPLEVASVKARFHGAAAAPALTPDRGSPVLRVRTSMHPASAPRWTVEGATP